MIWPVIFGLVIINNIYILLYNNKKEYDKYNQKYKCKYYCPCLCVFKVIFTPNSLVGSVQLRIGGTLQYSASLSSLSLCT